MVSCIFTLTEDLDAEFPAVAARRLGLNHVPLLCASEVPVPGSLPQVIRVLVHYYASEQPRAPPRVPRRRPRAPGRPRVGPVGGRLPIEFAQRIRRIPSYPVASGYDLGADMAMLASNESCFAPVPEVVAGGAGRDRGIQPLPGSVLSRLRSALAARYGVPADRIALGNGSCDILLAAGEALLEPGAEMVLCLAGVLRLPAPGGGVRGACDRGPPRRPGPPRPRARSRAR